jgi:hypothetical protein
MAINGDKARNTYAWTLENVEYIEQTKLTLRQGQLTRNGHLGSRGAVDNTKTIAQLATNRDYAQNPSMSAMA